MRPELDAALKRTLEVAVPAAPLRAIRLRVNARRMRMLRLYYGAAAALVLSVVVMGARPQFAMTSPIVPSQSLPLPMPAPAPAPQTT